MTGHRPKHLGVDGLHTASADVLDDRPQPVAVGAQLDDVGAGPTQVVALVLDPDRRGVDVAALHRGSHPDLTAGAGRRVDKRHQTDRWNVTLAGIMDRDRQQVVAHSQADQRVDPPLTGEVGDHADEAASPAEAVDAIDRPAEVAAPEMLGRRR